VLSVVARGHQKSMPPPGGIAGAGFFSGTSPTIASLVSIKPATDAASCNAVRTTLVGSMIPAFSRAAPPKRTASSHRSILR